MAFRGRCGLPRGRNLRILQRVVKAISGVQTVRFKNELERNITIKLGYANAKIFRNTGKDGGRGGSGFGHG